MHIKELILNNARRLILDKGYGNASTRDIARACGINQSNIYSYFPSKEHLLFELLKQTNSQLVSAVQMVEREENISPVERLWKLIKTHIELTLNRPTSFLALETELRHLNPAHRIDIIEIRDVYDRILLNIIQEGVDRGDFARLDVKMASYAIASIIIRTRLWFSPEGRLSPDEIAAFIFKFALNGLGVGENQTAMECAVSKKKVVVKNIGDSQFQA